MDVPALDGVHHLKLPVTDVDRSLAWYESRLGYVLEVDFVEQGVRRGVALRHPNGGPGFALRLDPERARAAAGFDYFAIGVPDRPAIEALAEHLSALDEEHAGVQHASIGWIVSVHDPDGHEVRFYTTKRLPHEVRPSLYEHAGGDGAILALARAHHARCLADPELNHPFARPEVDPHHVERLAAYWTEALGGPPRWSAGLGGDHSAVLRMHAGEGDLTDMGRRFVDCFVGAADDAGLPDDPEFRAALRAYMEWAVQELLRFPEGDDDVPAGLPVPRWSWDGLDPSSS